MFEIQKNAEFAAAHALRGYDGPCARPHGHNYKVEIVVRGKQLDDQRMLIDFVHLDRILAPVLAKVDHRNLNEIPPFDEVNPTAEAVAAWFYGELKGPIESSSQGRAFLTSVRIREMSDSCVTYSEDN